MSSSGQTDRFIQENLKKAHSMQVVKASFLWIRGLFIRLGGRNRKEAPWDVS